MLRNLRVTPSLCALLLCAQSGLAQCSDVYIYMPIPFLSSEETVDLFVGTTKIGTMSEGTRYKATVCGSGSYDLEVVHTGSTLSAKERLEIRDAAEYYVKASFTPGVSVPLLKQMDLARGRKDLRSNSKFNTAVTEISIGNTQPDSKGGTVNDSGNTRDQPSKSGTISAGIDPIGVASKSGTAAKPLPAESLREGREPLTHLSYLFYSGGSVIDVRTGETKIKNCLAGVIRPIDDNHFVVGAQNMFTNKFEVYSKSYNKSKEYSVIGKLSPNWKYVLYIEQGDIWRKDIDLRTGSISTPKQVTQLGIFKHLSHLAWQEDDFYIAPYNSGGMSSGTVDEVYRINTKLNSLIKTNFKIQFSNEPWYSSPSNRYFFLDSDVLGRSGLSYQNRLSGNYIQRTSLILDPATGAAIGDSTYIFNKPQLNSQSYTFWSDINTFHTMCLNDNADYIIRTITVNIKPGRDLILSASKVLSPSPREHAALYYSNAVLEANLHGKSTRSLHNIWHDGNHVVYNVIAERGNPIRYNVNSMSLLTGEVTSWNTYGLNATMQDQPMAWATPDAIVYTMTNDLATQGTYVRDLITNTHTKISPYIAENIIKFPGTGIVVFNFDKRLFKYNHNDKILTDLKLDNIRIDYLWVMEPRYLKP